MKLFQKIRTRKNITNKNKNIKRRTLRRGGMVEEDLSLLDNGSSQVTLAPDYEKVVHGEKYSFLPDRHTSKVASGGFGSVHKTISPQGTHYATKIIRVGEELTKYMKKQRETELNLRKDPYVLYDELLKIREERLAYKIASIENEVNILQKLSSFCGQYVLCFVGLFKKETPLEYYLITEGLFNYVTLFDYIFENIEYIESIQSIRDFMDEPRRKKHPVSIAGSQLFNQDKDKHTPPLLSMYFIELVSNLCNGLHLLHQMGIAHRDIKPENIMIFPETRQIKYIDFGISCDSSSTFDVFCKRKLVGTLNTIDPYLNKISKDSMNHAIAVNADLWSLGIVIFFCVAQNYPYQFLDADVNHRDFNELTRIYTNENSSSIWNQRNVLTIFEIVKQHHRKSEELNKQTHLPDHKRYSSALLEELLSPDRSKRTLHIAQEAKPSKKSMKKAAALELTDVPIVSGPEEAIAQATDQATLYVVAKKSKKSKRKTKKNPLTPIAEDKFSPPEDEAALLGKEFVERIR
jgi:serine/threonine protein kinase